MVYCGKPSKSCRQCRKRNIKCDKKKDSCGQCIRAGLTCPGYHNPQNLTFRDETTTVMRKAFEEHCPPIFPHIVFSIEYQAKQLFISHYVFSTSPPLGYMKTFWPVDPDDKYITYTVRAVCLAYLFNKGRSTEVLQRARKAYGSALIHTNKVLHSQDVALKNVTLNTILLLAFFENLVNNEPRSTPSVTKHLDGALVLLKLRGSSQFQDSVSISMFQLLSSILIPSCLERGTGVPKDFARLYNQASRFVSTDDLEWRLTDLMIQIAKLRASLKESEAPDTQAEATIRYLDLELLHISKCMKRSGSIETSNCQSPSSEKSDRYPSQQLDRERNLRLARTLLDEMLSSVSLDPA